MREPCIDADLLVTDAVPTDVLLQRCGRLQRHERTRPKGYGTRRVLVLNPGDPGACPTADAKRPSAPRRATLGVGLPQGYRISGDAN